MTHQPPHSDHALPLDQRLLAAAQSWAETCESTLAKLGRLVVNDTAFFTSMEKSSKGPSIATLAKFARFLAQPANWPDGQVSEEALGLAHVTGVSVQACALSAGNTGQLSSEGEAA